MALGPRGAAGLCSASWAKRHPGSGPSAQTLGGTKVSAEIHMRPHAVWHYGLMAEYWALFKHDTPELPGLVALIHRYGQPVLDLCCGTGRVLLSLIRAGIDVDGIDVSEDMIELARAAAARLGYAPSLYVQPMSGLATVRSYRAIVIVDSFGLGGDRDEDLATLRRCRSALQPGGALILNTQME